MSGEGTGEEQLFDFLADLEAQAGALQHRERIEQVNDRSRSAYAEVTLESRLMASLGHTVTCEVRGVGRLEGTLDRVGHGWCVLLAGRRTWSVRIEALVLVRGASSRSVPREAWPAADRLGFPARLRRVAENGTAVVLHLDDGTRRDGRLGRVGGDFVELGLPIDPAARASSLPLDLVATARISAVRTGA